MALLFADSLPQNNSRTLQASIKFLELLLLSAGLISTFLVVKEAVVPYPCEIVFSSLVGFWNSIKCLFSSLLYIWIIINLVFVLILASSIFHHCGNDSQDYEFRVNIDDHDMHTAESPLVSPPPPAPPPSPPAILSPRTKISTKSTISPTLSQGSNTNDSPHLWPNRTTLFLNEVLMSEAHEIKKTDLSGPIMKKMTTTNLRPLPTKGKEVLKEKEDEVISTLSELDEKESEEEDTMEATWKAITGGGKQRPKKKNLKKSETWDVPPRRSTAAVQRLDSEELLPTTPKWKELRKSETFNDAVSISRRGGLRRDPSMSPNEFNKQVEGFIKKFNDSMRLQRQESDQRFLDMIQRGL